MIVVGIDPGKNGAMCRLGKENEPFFIDFKDIGIDAYIAALYSLKPTIVIVEKVHSMPNQGVVSTFSFGQRLGELEGMLRTLHLPYELILPQVWQKEIGIPPKSDKKEIAEFISSIYPNASLYGSKGGLLDGRSDALCLAHYARLKYIKEK
ncbi:hypothetical protein [Campylobacter fetus]|uniref:hypothetical protein n=1 Tax=Campylobacter fetus TaxID=196 RepID=UPI000FCB4F53|nr:hypothetical protein [Campylobacter fetus]RUT50951.1 hypothetical protein BWK67_00060 [Campylobacter fetus]RUT51679.1 hypothetical protein BWK51_00060 [Campylobacter fetus]